MKPEDIPKPVHDLIARVPDDNVVLVAPEGGQITILNNVGTTIWSLIDGQNNLQFIAEQLVEQYDVDISQAYRDLEIFITRLDSKNLISWE